MECGAGAERLSNKLNGFLEQACKRLLQYDENIVEIVQFGSSVYAPEYAVDVDIAVITRKAKEYDGYLDAANLGDVPLNIDVLVLDENEVPRQELLRGMLGSFKILYGSGERLLNLVKALGDPSFEEARSSLRVAGSLLKLAMETANAMDKDRLVREAFDAVFHSSRIASMVYLSTEVARWGLIRKELPEPYRSSFKEFIDTLHIKYFYHGNYPKEMVEEEFEHWYRKVEEFVNSLEEETKKRR